VLTPFSPPRRRPDLTKVLTRAALLLCGIALTWVCAACGLFLVTMPHRCGSNVRRAVLQARAIDNGLVQAQFEHGRCPTRDELIAGKYVAVRELIDPWGTSIAFSCAGDAIIVKSAGPDRLFGTADDVTNE